jgi:hypothetical protein
MYKFLWGWIAQKFSNLKFFFQQKIVTYLNSSSLISYSKSKLSDDDSEMAELLTPIIFYW